MGHSHATSGALAFAAAIPALHLAGVEPSLPTILAGTLATAGAALLPDADHPDGTISHFLWPISHWFCRFVHWAARGHRELTHTLLFVPFAAGLSWGSLLLAGHVQHTAWLPWILLLVLIALGVRALNISRHLGGLLAAVATVLLYRSGASLTLLPLAVGLGCLMHILGDALTVEGVPMLFPHARLHKPKTWSRWPILGHAGSKIELVVFSPLMTAATCVLLWVNR